MHRRLRRSTSSSPPPGCASWPRWTARSSSTATCTRILRAAVHLVPDPTHPDRGVRHPAPHRRAGGQADRLPGHLGAASRCRSSRCTSTAAATCSRTPPRSCPAPTRRWPPSSATSCASTRSSGTLSALEIEDLVTVRDVAAVAQRLEMVRRIADEIEGYVVELGTDGRLLSLQLDELIGRRRRRPRAGRPRLPARPAAAPRTRRRGAGRPRRAVAPPTCSTSAPVARALGFASVGDALDAAVSPRGYRLLAKVPRLPGAVVDRLVEHFGSLQKLLAAEHRRPAGRRGRRRDPRPRASARACPGWPSRASSSATSERCRPVDREPSGVPARVHRGARLVRRARPRPAVAATRRARRGACWSPRSCSSRPRWPGCEPVWREWLARWPTPAALAAEPPGEAVRAWGRLGYPRRALRLHEAAAAIVARHGGQVPDVVRRAARAAGRRRLHRGRGRELRLRRARTRSSTPTCGGCWPGPSAGRALPAPALTGAEQRAGRRGCCRPTAPTSATWNVAVMELGALVCTRPLAALRRVPGARPVRLGARRLARRTTGRRAAGRPGTAPTGRCAGRCWRRCATATGR